MSEGFSAKETVDIVGVPYRTLDYWDRSDFVKPSLAAAAGKGTDRRYSFRDLVSLRVAVELRRSGISLQELRRVLRHIPELTGADAPFSEQRVIVVGDDVAIVNGENLQSALLAPGQLYMSKIILDLGDVVQLIRKRIAA